MSEHDIPNQEPQISFISGLFGVFLGVAAALALAPFVVPSANYLSLSNYLTVLVAFTGSATFLFLSFRYGYGTGMLYAAGAFALCGVAVLAGYAAPLVGTELFAFPGILDMGFVAALLLLSSAYSRIYPRKQVRGLVLLAILLLTLLVPIALLAAGGITRQALMILLYFFACGSLLITGLNHSLPDNPMALAGTLLFAVAFMVYPLREAFFTGNPYLSILGAFITAGFCLIVLGILSPASRELRLEPEKEAPPRTS